MGTPVMEVRHPHLPHLDAMVDLAEAMVPEGKMEEAAEDRDLRVEAEATELLKRPLTLYTVHPLPPLALLWPAMGRLCPLTGSRTNFPLTVVGRVVAPLPPTLCPFTFPARIKLTIIIITI